MLNIQKINELVKDRNAKIDALQREILVNRPVKIVCGDAELRFVEIRDEITDFVDIKLGPITYYKIPVEYLKDLTNTINEAYGIPLRKVTVEYEKPL